MDYTGENNDRWDIWIPECGGNADKVDDSAKDAMKELAGLVSWRDRRDYTITEYVNDVTRENEEVLAELNHRDKVTTAYTYGYNRESADVYGDTQYYLYDGKGNVDRISSEWGRVKETYNYDLYGNLTYGIPDTVNYYGYNGESSNLATGLQYLRARYYNPQTGSFITEDTYAGQISNPLTLNRYDYVSNNPVNYVDPSGHYSLPKWMQDGLNAVGETLENIGNAILESDLYRLYERGYEIQQKNKEIEQQAMMELYNKILEVNQKEKEAEDKITSQYAEWMVEAVEEAGEDIKTAVQQHKEVTQRQEEVEQEVRQALCDYFETEQGQGVIYLTVTIVDLVILAIITYLTGGLTALPLVGGLTGATSGAITGAMQESEFSDEAFYNVTKNMFDSTLYFETLGVIGAIAPQLFTNPVSITMTDAGMETLLDSVYALKEDVTLTLSTVMWGFLSNVVTEGALPFKQIDELLSHFKGVKTLDDFKAKIKWLSEGGSKAVPNMGFDDFTSLKKHMGDPGEGNAWHHIVEQSQIGKRANFDANQVHNVNNIIAIPAGADSIHSKISAHYSSKFDFTDGLTVRDWLSTKSFDEQFEYGKELLEEYGEVIATDNGWIFKPY